MATQSEQEYDKLMSHIDRVLESFGKSVREDGGSGSDEADDDSEGTRDSEVEEMENFNHDIDNVVSSTESDDSELLRSCVFEGINTTGILDIK